MLGFRVVGYNLGFSLQIAQGVVDHEPVPFASTESISLGLSRYRRHGQLSISCIPNLHVTILTNHVWLKQSSSSNDFVT